MAASLAADNLSISSGSRRNWSAASFRNVLGDPGDVFRRSNAHEDEDEDEDEAELKWAALEKLPTYDRMRKGVLKRVLENGKVVSDEVDIGRLGVQERKLLVESILKTVEEDNERFLRRLRERIDLVGIELPRLEVRFENLCVEANAHVGTRALPTLLNAAMNTIEGMLGSFKLSWSKKRINKILSGVSGILRPSRMTLLLGPPGSGKTTLLLALSGKLDKNLRVSGKITYCGHELSEIIPQRTCAYIGQHDLHNGEMTVRETLNFSGRVMGVGTRYEMLSELSRREKDAGIKPDPEIDAFMKATALEGQDTSVVTDYILKILGLDICADTMIGDEMRRGVSGGQKKRVTTGEMLVGPSRVLFMDAISTGLDSSTTFQIVKFMKQMVLIMDGTMIISLLQPAPETYELFDDIILLSEGQIVYQGPRDNILEFFELMGFKCPERKAVADFLQEVTSKKDQERYWFNKDKSYKYISVSEFSQFFNSFYIGQRLVGDLRIPFDKSSTHPGALVRNKYGISSWELFKACLSREWLLMKRNSFVYIFKVTQITVMSTLAMTVFLRTTMHHETIAQAGKYLGALFFGLVNVMFNGMTEMAMVIFKLPVFYKQRDFLFYPPWAFGLSIWLLKIPISLLESGIWVVLTYYVIGFAPAANRLFRQFLALSCVHQMALALFRFIAAAGRTMVIANTFGTLALLVIFVLGGFVISKDDIQPWWIWGYWISPMMYGQNAVAINEFLDSRWNTPNNDTTIDAPTVGKAILKSRGLFGTDNWYWISIGALIGYSLLFNACFIAALTYLNPIENSQVVTVDENADAKQKPPSPDKGPSSVITEISSTNTALVFAGTDVEITREENSCTTVSSAKHELRRGMVLPFQPLSLTFSHVNYYVDMPSEMKNRGVIGDRLQLLCDVGGAFQPGILTALVGVSGAGKTTLMDVLAGRKTGGYIEGSISVSGYPKNQSTFARVSGYCEQNDIHSPNVTVYESLVYSAWLRLSSDVTPETRQMFVEEIMELVELDQLRDALVGLPGVDGLSTEQRKRLTVAVELVANPSIIFMDEPTSGLDARAAAIVMRTVRNTVNTGRTLVCTIHQPGIDIFEAFDELLLMKRGGQVIYAGSLGLHSQKLIEYFEAIPGIPKIKDGYNPATWMLEISSPSVEAHLNLDFAEVYTSSSLYQRNLELIEELSTPAIGSKDLHFPTKYSRSFGTQYVACLWKQHWSYWKNPPYNAIRFFMTLASGFLFGTIFWGKGEKLGTQQELFNLLGAVYAAIFFLGATNATTVQPVVAIERTVFYRERAAGMYSAVPYALAQVSIEIMYVVVQSILYAMLLFSMISFSWEADKVFWFVYFIVMCFVYFSLFGMMVVALSPGFEIAGIVSSFFFTLWNLFSGFLIFRPLIPIWWRWYYWLNPVALTIYGTLVSQLGDKESMVEIPGQSGKPVNVFLKETLGFEHSSLGYIAAAHVGFVVVFFCVFAYGIKFLNFQKR